MSTICLCMIVKNDAAAIERCLDSVRGLIDTWVICDTGSEDGTPDVIRRALEGIPGTLHEVESRDLGENRTELTQLARGAADYLLMLDADDTVSIVGSMPGTLTADSYLIRRSGPTELYLKRLIRSDTDWRYVGSTGEYLVSKEQHTEERLDAIVIDRDAGGGVRTDKSERSVFHLAQTYREMGKHEQALELYQRRASMGGFPEEVFYSLYQSGLLLAELDDWPHAMEMLIAAFEFRPSRLEPLYEISSRLRRREEYETAHLFAMRGVGRAMPPDVLFMQPWLYRWGMLFEYSITCYWTGNTKISLQVCNQLLALPDLPALYREQTVANKRFCVQRLAQATAERRGPGSSTPLPAPRRR